jgi:hypothetical protein
MNPVGPFDTISATFKKSQSKLNLLLCSFIHSLSTARVVLSVVVRKNCVRVDTSKSYVKEFFYETRLNNVEFVSVELLTDVILQSEASLATD